MNFLILILSVCVGSILNASSQPDMGLPTDDPGSPSVTSKFFTDQCLNVENLRAKADKLTAVSLSGGVFASAALIASTLRLRPCARFIQEVSGLAAVGLALFCGRKSVLIQTVAEGQAEKIKRTIYYWNDSRRKDFDDKSPYAFCDFRYKVDSKYENLITSPEEVLKINLQLLMSGAAYSLRFMNYTKTLGSVTLGAVGAWLLYDYLSVFYFGESGFCFGKDEKHAYYRGMDLVVIGYSDRSVRDQLIKELHCPNTKLDWSGPNVMALIKGS